MQTIRNMILMILVLGSLVTPQVIAAAGSTSQADNTLSVDANSQDALAAATDSDHSQASANSQSTTLSAGDVVVIGISADHIDEFSWMPLVDIAAGTEIYFTDHGFFTAPDPDQFSFSIFDWLLRFTAPAGGISAGDVQTVISGQEGSNYAFTGNGSLFNTNHSSITLNNGGDSIIVFQSTSDPTAAGFGIIGSFDFTPIFATTIATTDWTSSTLTNNNIESNLPTGLTDGVNAVAAGAGAGARDEYDNVRYTGSLDGTRAEVLARVVNVANWEGVDSPSPPSGWTDISGGAGGTVVSGSGGSGPIAPPGNQPPVLSTPMPDITVTEGAADQTFNALDYFSDPEGDALYFTVVSNSNREVAPSFLVGLEFDGAIPVSFGQLGETTITIRAAEDAWHRTYQGTFKITVLDGPEPALSMSKSVSTQMVEAGEQVTYTLTITNSGAGSATNAQLSDTLPAGLTFVDGSLSGTGLGVGTLGSAPPMLAEGVTLAANQSINISFAATVNADVMANQMITNTAQITSSEMLTPMLASEWIMTGSPTLMISDTIVTESQPASRAINISNNNATVAVNLSKASALPIMVEYTTVPGSATADDYTPTSGTLTIEAGQTEGHINLTITDDELAEQDETFTIQLSNPTHATMTDAEAVVTISSNDQPPTAVSLTQMDAQSSTGMWYAGALAALMLVSGCLWVMHRKEE